VEALFNKNFVDKLGMSHSSYTVPKNFSNSVIPISADWSGFDAELGNENPVGGYFSSQADYTKLGQSLLSASLLSPETIRAWMKLDTLTSSAVGAFGKPWEIFRIPDVVVRMLNLAFDKHKF
jgi:CubicO group peptidase (beta-lactamase class C family)